MTSRHRRSLLIILFVTLIPATSHAQLGRLKQLGKDLIEKKAGISQTANAQKPKQWKKSERVPPFTAAELDRFINAWDARIEYSSLSDQERERRDQAKRAKQDAYEAKKDKYETCKETAFTQEDAMQLQQQMVEKAMQGGMAGDANAGVKAAEWMQKAAEQKIEKKCGKAPVKPVEPAEETVDYRMEEWLTAYIAVREESDAATAAGIVLASDEEAALLEARLDKLRRLAKGERIR